MISDVGRKDMRLGFGVWSLELWVSRLCKWLTKFEPRQISKNRFKTQNRYSPSISEAHELEEATPNA
jgi:hypothetical protein